MHKQGANSALDGTGWVAYCTFMHIYMHRSVIRRCLNFKPSHWEWEGNRNDASADCWKCVGLRIRPQCQAWSLRFLTMLNIINNYLNCSTVNCCWENEITKSTKIIIVWKRNWKKSRNENFRSLAESNVNSFIRFSPFSLSLVPFFVPILTWSVISCQTNTRTKPPFTETISDKSIRTIFSISALCIAAPPSTIEIQWQM